MEEVNLSATPRQELGSKPAKRLRRNGRIPAVLYGPGIKDAIPLALDRKELDRIMHVIADENVLVNLTIEGEDKPRKAMFKDIAFHPVEDTVQHIDLLEVLMDHKVVVEVPLHFVGRSEGVASGGLLQVEARRLRVECLPVHIPEHIEVDVTSLRIGQSLHVKDLKLPEGLKAKENPDLTIVAVLAPKVEAEVVRAEEAEAPQEEKAEG